MEVSQQILFFLSALGAFNGVLLAVYFLTVKPRHPSNLFLAILLLVICIRITKSVFLFFNPSLDKTFLQIGLSACFFIGPCVYFYCLSCADSLKQQWVKWQIHVGLLLLIIAVMAVVFPFKQNPKIWSYVFPVIHYQWLIYLLASTYVLRNKFATWYRDGISITDNSLLSISVLLGNWLIWFAYFTSAYTSYIVGALSFSFVCYLLVLTLVINYRQRERNKKEKYQDKKIEGGEADLLTEKLSQLMQSEKLYTNANLTLPQVAKRIGVLTPRLSQLLNDNINKSFNAYINEYRIAHAKQLLQQKKAMKMDDIADESGFNSNSTFYTAFKKVTATTPAKYRSQYTQ